LQAALRSVVDGFPHEVHTEASSAIQAQDVDVAEIGNVDVVGEHAGKPDLAVAVVKTHNARCLPHRAGDGEIGTATGPVGLLTQIGMDSIHINPITIVV
jgi:hypothetical protein